MIVVTGAAGFIGSCVVSQLNARQRNDLIVVDHIGNLEKKKNLEGKKYLQYLEKHDFIKAIENDTFQHPVTAIIHMGACSSTTLQDATYFDENNLKYTQKLAKWAMARNVRFIYASSAATYGDGSQGYSDDHATIRHCHPLNLYGLSKQNFDLWALDNNYLDKMVGLKFFNVFGPNEYHKGDMRSVVAKAFDRVVREGKMELFKSYHAQYGDGEQKRDFIYVKDAVDVVMFFFDNPHINGIFNVGTGKARTWNDLANALFKAVNKPVVLEYIPMPEILRDKYQYFTQADMSKLKKVGFTKPFRSLEDAVLDYSRYLKEHTYL